MWDLEADGCLECELTLPQPPGDGVFALAAVDGEVWAGIGRAVVVWGRT